MKEIHIEKKGITNEAKRNPFTGSTIVVTGRLTNFTRDQVNAKIESLGAKAGSAVTRNTDFLICGDKAGRKLNKAIAMSVVILSEDQFIRMAEGT